MPTEDAGRLSTSSARSMSQRRRGRKEEVNNIRLRRDRTESLTGINFCSDLFNLMLK